MLAQVTYIQKFIMADSEDEFMLISVAASAAFVAMSQRIYRPGVGLASAGRQYHTYLIPPADVVRASARRTTPGRCHDFWHLPCSSPTPIHIIQFYAYISITHNSSFNHLYLACNQCLKTHSYMTSNLF